MQKSPCQVKGVLDKATSVKPFGDGREVVPLLSSIQHYKEEGNIQKPISYTNQAFQGAKASYPRMEKIVFALLVASRKLHPYFETHPIVIMTD